MRVRSLYAPPVCAVCVCVYIGRLGEMWVTVLGSVEVSNLRL